MCVKNEGETSFSKKWWGVVNQPFWGGGGVEMDYPKMGGGGGMNLRHFGGVLSCLIEFERTHVMVGICLRKNACENALFLPLLPLLPLFLDIFGGLWHIGSRRRGVNIWHQNFLGWRSIYNDVAMGSGDGRPKKWVRQRWKTQMEGGRRVETQWRVMIKNGMGVEMRNQRSNETANNHPQGLLGTFSLMATPFWTSLFNK